MANKSEIMNLINAAKYRENLPQFRAGDTINVHIRIREGDKERIQQFEGVCLGIRGQGTNKTFMVRKVSHGVGVERIFPLHSPFIDKIDVVRTGAVRRAKLYYLRQLSGKASRITEQERSPVPQAGGTKDTDKTATGGTPKTTEPTKAEKKETKKSPEPVTTEKEK